jgi:hypothetical protein
MKLPASTWFFIGSFHSCTDLNHRGEYVVLHDLGEVNGRRPEKDQINIWELRGRLYQVLRLHAELYPNSPKRRQMWVLITLGAAFLFGGSFVTAMLNSGH